MLHRLLVPQMVRLVRGSLLDLTQLDLGVFDYIECHTPNAALDAAPAACATAPVVALCICDCVNACLDGLHSACTRCVSKQ